MTTADTTLDGDLTSEGTVRKAQLKTALDALASDIDGKVTSPVGVTDGGTGAATLTDGGLLVGSGTGAVTALAVLADGAIVIGDGTTDPVALAAFSSSTGTLKVANGGSGAATHTDGGLLIGKGTSAFENTGVLADGTVVIGDGTTNPTTLAAFSSATGTLGVANGGIGVGTLTDGGILLGSGTGAVTAMAVLADGSIVVGDGTTDPVALAAFSSSTGNLLSAKGGTIGKHTIWVPVAAMRPTTSNGCSAVTDFETTAGRPDIQVMYFDGAADEHAQFAIALPKGWNEGTITFRAFSAVTDTAATDGTDTVSWGLQGLSVADDASIDQAYGTGVVVTEATSGTVEDIAISAESSAVTISAAAVDTLSYFRAYRDVSADDMTEDAGLIGYQVFITIDAGEDT